MFDGLFAPEYGQFLSMMFGWAGACIILAWLFGPVVHKVIQAAKKGDSSDTDVVGEDPKVLENAKKLPGIFVGVKGVHD